MRPKGLVVFDDTLGVRFDFYATKKASRDWYQRWANGRGEVFSMKEMLFLGSTMPTFRPAGGHAASHSFVASSWEIIFGSQTGSQGSAAGLDEPWAR